MKKPWIVAGAAVVVLGAAVYVGSSGVLQGRLSGVANTKPTTTVVGTTGSSSTSGKSKVATDLKNTSGLKSGTTTTTTPLLTISAATMGSSTSAMRQTVNINEVDFEYDYNPEDPFDVDPTWFAIGEFELVYDKDVSNCTNYYTSILMTDEKSYAQYLDKVFANVRLQFRDSNKDIFMDDPYVYAEDGYSLSYYSLENVNMTGDKYYFYVEGQAKPDVDASYLDKEYSVYLRSTCAEKDGTVYSWSDGDDTGQNSYFDADFDGKYGVLGGTVTVKE